MSLATGSQLGSYTVVGPLGAGGMGEVYRATDAKLDREVAIKVLPEPMAKDPERVARFEREAKMLASLHHPLIATIYGFEQANGSRFLVLELIEGLTLAERIAAGTLTVEDSLGIARQIAEALEAAHEKSIIHRDLKPANVKITPDGQIKVLDFGLAKALTEDAPDGDAGTSPTITREFTQPGVILGTAAYMSPEQARGRVVDKRSDIWSFGCLLYECLTGEAPFKGETVTDILGAIMHQEPDWSALPTATPDSVRRLLARLLVKDRKQRLRDVGDALLELCEEPSQLVGPAEPRTAQLAGSRARKSWAMLGGWILTACLTVVSVLLYVRGSLPKAELTTDEPARMHVHLPDSQPFCLAGGLWSTSLAISPDGNWIAYVGWGEPQKQLYYRRMDATQWTTMPNSGGAHSPFFSPDGTKLGFFTINSMMVATLGTNERPRRLASTIPVAGGACWEDNNTILYLSAPRSEGIRRTKLHFDESELALATDLVIATLKPLPGGKQVLLAFAESTLREWELGVADFETQKITPLNLKGKNPHYDAESQRIVYVSDRNVLSAPFDLKLGKTTGPAELLDSDVIQKQVAELSVSSNGRLLYAQARGSRSSKLVSIDPYQPSRNPDFLVEGPLESTALRVHPTENKVAVIVSDDDDSWKLRIFNLDSRRWDATPNNPGAFTVWGPESKIFTYFSGLRVHSSDLSGNATPEPLFDDGGGADFPTSWHPDGNFLLYTNESGDATHHDVRFFSRIDGTTSDFVKSGAVETAAVFSPNGEWVAYQSNAQGRFDIYIRPFPPQHDPPLLVSAEGGTEPMWSRDTASLQLYYRNGQKMMSVDFQPNSTPKVSEATELFRGRYTTGSVRAEYDTDAEGRFLMIEPTEEISVTHLNIITNWNARHLGP